MFVDLYISVYEIVFSNYASEKGMIQGVIQSGKHKIDQKYITYLI